MITFEMIKDSIEGLSTVWEKAGERVVEVCAQHPPLNITFKEFLNHCYACGGNWGGMLLTGVKELRPEVWEAIPDDMGPHAIGGIVATLILCGVDTTE